jgi:hypothetical protein
MAIFYTGYRPVTKGRNTNDSEHPLKGVGEYSNYHIWNTSHVLDGAPNNDHTPGTGYHPGDYYLSSIMMGAFNNPHIPLADPGNGPALTWYERYSSLLGKRGQDGQNAFGGRDFGHEPGRITDYSFSRIRDLEDRVEPLSDAGHELRGRGDEGAAHTFGRFAPYINKGVTPSLPTVGQYLPDDGVYDNDYGHNKPKEWRGVPSSRAL